uniref:LIM zinc-binding domain-containing protein n=1 Tax=Vespula pensylvanica TaxID=30213 RepID=A0A834NWQ6_VESPE|nr:hypothetical protein H0235_010247 [Vespula pensylvanica]
MPQIRNGFVENFDIHRFVLMSQLIFSGEYTKAMNKDWHSGHFCCWQCDESLTGQRYVLRDEHPYCIKCYESVFANGCEECNKIIGIDSKDLSYKDKHWHEACFLCNRCRVSLVDKQFGSKVDKIYCGNCYDAQFASRCDGCGEIFRAGTKKMEYKTRQWHEKCFCCVVCKNPIGTKSFIPREQEIYCAGCYEDKFATRCVKCNKIITSGGVTYKNEPWHRDCFTCSNCNNSLAGQRFTSRDDKPYCADCFGELFAKRCTACSKPITGIGGTRFISFEDRHWHNECFICAGCKTSLVGRGFITDGDDIICPECAKAKLMMKMAKMKLIKDKDRSLTIEMIEKWTLKFADARWLCNVPRAKEGANERSSARGKARSMESGIIADVDWLKESTGGDPLPYLCNERARPWCLVSSTASL